MLSDNDCIIFRIIPLPLWVTNYKTMRSRKLIYHVKKVYLYRCIFLDHVQRLHQEDYLTVRQGE